MLTVTATLLFLGKLGDRIGSHRIYTARFWDLPWARYFVACPPPCTV